MIYPTLGLLSYLVILAAVYLFRLAYIGWVGPLFLTFVLAGPGLMLLLSILPALRVRLALKLPKSCTRQEEVWASLQVRGLGLLPLPCLKVCLETVNRFTGETQITKSTFRNVGNGEYLFPLPTQWCGDLRVRLLWTEIRDLLGLFAWRRKSALKAGCTVLPSVKAPSAPPDLETVLSTSVTLKPKYGGGYSEEHDLREYRPGDTVNSIHWKLSSKTDQVIVREPLVNANTEIFLVLSRVGLEDRGLEVLYWLSLELCRMEQAHTIVADQLYAVGNETEALEAFAGLLSRPMDEPCSYDASRARCVFLISGEEVRVK